MLKSWFEVALLLDGGLLASMISEFQADEVCNKCVCCSIERLHHHWDKEDAQTMKEEEGLNEGVRFAFFWFSICTEVGWERSKIAVRLIVTALIVERKKNGMHWWRILFQKSQCRIQNQQRQLKGRTWTLMEGPINGIAGYEHIPGNEWMLLQDMMFLFLLYGKHDQEEQLILIFLN